MKFTISRKSLLVGSILGATVVLTGCPSSREGSGTGTGHGPAKMVGDTTNAGKKTRSSQGFKSTPDTSGAGTGHKPK